LLYIGVTLLGFPEREVWKMTPYKITTLWKIHKEFNRDKFRQDEETEPTASGVGDIDRAMETLGW